MDFRKKIIKSLSVEDISKYNHPPQIDVVISVGGFYGFYVLGVHKILSKLENLGRLKIERYSGSSVGAICSVLMCSGVSHDKIIQIYHDLLNHRDYFIRLKQILLNILPDDAFLQCSGRVSIIATAITKRGFQSHRFTNFSSNEDLVDACLASSNCPYFVSPYLYYKYKNYYYIDGCFSSMLPVFEDDNHIQLCIKLYKLKNSIYNMFFPNDFAIEGLIVKGAIETNAFFNNHPTSDVICWFDKNMFLIKKKQKKYKYLFYLSMSIMGISVFYFIQKKKK